MTRQTIRLALAGGFIALAGLVGFGLYAGWFGIIFGNEQATYQTRPAQLNISSADTFNTGNFDGTSYRDNAL